MTYKKNNESGVIFPDISFFLKIISNKWRINKSGNNKSGNIRFISQCKKIVSSDERAKPARSMNQIMMGVFRGAENPHHDLIHKLIQTHNYKK